MLTLARIPYLGTMNNNTQRKLKFSCETGYYGKNSISMFQEFLTNIEKNHFERKTEH